jgi:hypothetical protein
MRHQDYNRNRNHIDNQRHFLKADGNGCFATLMVQEGQRLGVVDPLHNPGPSRQWLLMLDEDHLDVSYVLIIT